MTPATLFAQLAAATLARLADERPLPLPERIEELATLLGQLHVAALQLPRPAPQGLCPPTHPAAAPSLPDLGHLDTYFKLFDPTRDEPPVRCSLRDDLLVIHEGLHRGLQLWSDHPDHAVTLWLDGFGGPWGERVADAIPPLHRALAAFRSEARTRRSGLTPVDIVMLEEPRPDRPFLGVRFAAVGGGLEVLGVHPKGPTHGLLQPGDYLLAVDGTAFADLTAEAAGALLVGPIGEPRQLTLFREGETHQITIASAALPDEKLP